MLLLYIYKKKKGIYLILPTQNMTTWLFLCPYCMTIFSNQSEIQIFLFCFLLYIFLIFILCFVQRWFEKTDFLFCLWRISWADVPKSEGQTLSTKGILSCYCTLLVEFFSKTNTVYLVCVVHKLLIILWYIFE